MDERNVRTLLDLVVQADRELGDAPALAFVGEEPWSYHEIYSAASTLAGQIREKGIKRGDRVALLAESSPRWGIAYFAGILSGAVMVPILPDFHEQEIRSILEHSEASLLLISSKLGQRFTPEQAGLPGFVLEEAIGKAADPVELELPVIAPDDLACIIYTSGTTGNSKGVMLTHDNIICNAWTAEKIPNWTETTNALSVLPLAHTYEFTIGFVIILLKGGTVFYLKRPPSASVLIPALKKVRPQIMLSVPLLIEKLHAGIMKTKVNTHKLLKVLYTLPPARRLLNKVIGKSLMETFGGNLHFFGIGGAPLSKETEVFLREAGFPFSIGYGLTETSPLVAGGLSADIPFGSTGPVLPNLEYELRRSEDSGKDGELFVRGPSIMQGYYNDPERTAEVLSGDGWFRTGDLGRISADGSLTISGRAKTMILGSNGENIYPEQIEEVINSQDYVLESLVTQDTKTKGLVALIHLDYDQFRDSLKEGRILRELHHLEQRLLHRGEESFEEQVNRYLQEMLTAVNRQLSVISRLSQAVEQKDPFVRTPTQKIKRFLYEI